MGLENISRSVLEAAQKEAEHILKAARKAADEKVAAASAAAEQNAERRYQSAARTIEDDFARQIIQFRGVANKEILVKKNIRMREVFDAAKKQILAFPETEYAGIMRPLLEQSVGEDAGMVRVHPGDEKVFAQLLAELNQKRAATAQIKIDTAKPLEERGGFMFIGESYEIDQTLATLLADIERELAPRIAAQLFSE
ncbi:MAG TPA: V-type ATP synthase subunit E family protein [Candidatus Bathyarchaeia archaeon]|nr:V-type ATP synthase subunit E family protein [Candidatus Bathyarchaeia archaeon]